MANTKKSKRTIPKWAYIVSAIVILLAIITIYFCVPTVKSWVNGLFSETETEQPNEPPAELPKAETPANVPYEVTNTTITLMKISNAEYSLDCIYWQDSNVFTDLQPVTKYNVFVRIKETKEHLASDVYILEVTTDKATQEAPDISQITYTATGNVIKLSGLTGIESSIDNGTRWSQNTTHNGLDPVTEYVILVRYKETATQYASDASIIVVSTVKETIYNKPTLEIIGITSDSIVVRSNALNVEYSINNGDTWQDDTKFDSLSPSTEYTILARYKETNTQYASEPTSVTASTLATNNSGLFDNEGTLIYSWQRLLDNGYITVTNGVLDTRELDQNFTQDMLNNIFSSNLVIDNSVSEIADSAFRNTELTGVTIPASVTKIGASAFELTTNLQTLSFSLLSNLTIIGDRAFYNTRISEITLPNSLETIGDSAFQSAWLTSIHIPQNVTVIGNKAFSIGNLTSITVDENNQNYKSVESVLLNKNGTELIQYPSANIRSTYTIPNGVQIIHNNAFDDTENLTSVVIPEGVISIGSSSFSNSGITAITIPSTTTELGENLFSFCDNLTAINVADGNPNYMSTNGVLYAENGTKLLECPAGKTGDLVIPEGVTSIANGALMNLSNITSINIPSTLTNFGTNHYFDGCFALTTINVANDSTTYKSINGILYSKDGTTCLYYPKAKTDTTWIVPSTVTQLTQVAFEIADNLESIVFESTTPPDVFSTYILFDSKSLTFYVPDESLSAYQSANWFKNYVNRIKPVSEFQG